MDERLLHELYKEFPDADGVTIMSTKVSGFGETYFSRSLMIHLHGRVYLSDWGAMDHHDNRSINEAVRKIREQFLRDHPEAA